jgi:hypothetical protein
MLDDCTRKPQQQDFMTGMTQFNDLTKQRYGHSFADCSPKDRETLLRSIETEMKEQNKDANKPHKKKQDPNAPQPKEKELYTFYDTIKMYTVFGYTNSKYFMTKQVVYELVPGRYNALFPVKNIKKTAV